ncbi:MAG TPA: choice-of-anchor tandem repeat NxxGxxAF-containing protein [Natronosporangium sp.]|nr:choice-of-anchor tandem repeat NxxGxxAF-containing protein [Natronosporangium sp.]
MSSTRPPRARIGRSAAVLLGVVPVSVALLAAPSAAANRSEPVSSAYTMELQARTNLLVNDEGYNLPPGSAFNSISPHINNAGQVTFRVQHVADPNPATGRPGVWLGGHGEGDIVYTGETDWSIPVDPILNDHGDIVFALAPSIMESHLYVYDAASGTGRQVNTAPVLPNSYASPGIDNDGNLGFQASFSGGRAFAGFRDGAGIFYVTDSGLDASSPYTYLYTPAYNNAGQIAGKVSTSSDMTTEQEIRLFEPDGTSRLLLANQAVDPSSPYEAFDNSVGLNDHGVIAVVARRASDKQRVVVRSDGTTITEIAAVDPSGTIRDIEFFRPDINNQGEVVFRAVDALGQAIYVGDGSSLVRVAGKGDVVDTDLGAGQLGQHDTSPVFGGSPAINDHGDVVFTAGLHPKGDHLVEWGTGVFVAYRADTGEPGGVSEEIIATVPERGDEGSLIISVDPDDRTVRLPEMVAAGDRFTTSGQLRPVWVTDTRTANPGWDVTAQVSDFTSDSATFSGGFLGWTPTVGAVSDGQVVTPGEPVAPGFPTGDGLAVPRTLAFADAGAGLGTAELGADLDLQIPLDTPAGEYTAVLTITVI